MTGFGHPGRVNHYIQNHAHVGLHSPSVCICDRMNINVFVSTHKKTESGGLEER